MGFLDFFKSKKIEPEPIKEPEYMKKLRESVGGRLQDIVTQGPESYGGTFTAGLSPYEQQSFGPLSQFASQGLPSIVGEGANEISKTFSGTYDPETSAYYQAYRDQALNELDESKGRLKKDLAGHGMLRNLGSQEQVRKLEETTGRNLASTSAGLAERERDRRFSAVTPALQYGTYQEGQPLRQTEALQKYGALPRQIEQADLNALYNEFQRNLTQGRNDLTAGGSFAGDIQYAYPQYAPSGFSQSVDAFSKIMGAVSDNAKKAAPAAGAA